MTEEGSSSLREFVPLGKLGEGTFSSVYKVKRLSDQAIYALKKIKIASLKEKEKSNALNEIRILASLHSPHIITYKEAFFDEKLQLLCIVMELASDGDLLLNIKKHQQRKQFYPEAEVWRAALHIVRGLAVLHRHSILHRDLKSANIFLAEGKYKLGDLNVSKVNDHQQRLVHTQTGTPFYASPEIWRDQPYGSPSDIWSVGCILYEMCCLKPPFHGKDLDQLYRSVQRGHTDPLPKMYSTKLNQLIQLCLKQSPRERPSAEQLLSSNSLILTHCKHHGIDTDEVEQGPIQEQLLKTIKMPHDLRKLNSQLPSAKYQSQEQQVTTRPKTAQPRQKNVKTTPIEQSEPKIPLPQRIKNHLSSIERVSSQQLPHRRIQQGNLRSKITSSVALSVSQPLENYLTPPKLPTKQKQRPLSCNHLRPNLIRSNKAQEMSPYRLESLNQGPVISQTKPAYNSDRKLIGIRSSHRQKVTQLSDRKDPRPISKYITESQDPYMIQRQIKQQSDKMRCRSANIVPSAYSEIRQRLEARHRYLNPTLYRPSPIEKSGLGLKVRSQVRSEASIERSQQFGNNSYALPSSMSAQRHRPALAERHKQPEMASYLHEVQQKILSSANPKARKCDPLLEGNRPYFEAGSQMRRQLKGQNTFGRMHRV